MPKPRHIHEIYVRSTPDRVWSALIDPGEVRRTWTAFAPGAMAYEAPLAVGQPYRMLGDDGAAIDGTVVELVPGRRLVVTFHVLFDVEAAAEEPTTVTWEISPAGDDVCRLTLVHADFGGLSRTWVLTRDAWRIVLDSIKSALETGQPLGRVELAPEATASVVAVDLTAEEHRDRAIEINNETWGLLGRSDRSVEDDEAMVRCAYATAYHWSHAARRTIANEARAEWLLSRVHAAIGRGETALHHARRCRAAVATGGLVDFDLGYAHEATARALACLGRTEEAAAEYERARTTPVADPEDRAIYEGDLADGPWYGLVVSAPAPPAGG